MAKGTRPIDRKLNNIMKVIEEASATMQRSSEKSIDLITKIVEKTSEINQELQNSLATEEANETVAQATASQQYQKDVAPVVAMLDNHIDRIAKNHKALTGLLAAVKALRGEDVSES